MRSSTLTVLIAKEKNSTITINEQISLNKFMERIFDLNEYNNRQTEMNKVNDYVAPIDCDYRTVKLNCSVAP